MYIETLLEITKKWDYVAQVAHAGNPLETALAVREKDLDPNTFHEYSLSLLDLSLKAMCTLLEVGVDPTGVRNNGEVMLCDAAQFVDDTTFEYLLRYGANINVKNARGETPLIIASSLGLTKILKVLLRYKADVNLQDNEGNTALHYSCKTHDPNVVGLLLGYGCDVSIRNEGGHTAYDWLKEEYDRQDSNKRFIGMCLTIFEKIGGNQIQNV